MDPRGAYLADLRWLILERPDIVPERDLPDLIRRYNESVGGVNSDTEGYHETITQVFIRTLRRALARERGAGAGRAGQRAAAGAGGAAGLAAALLLAGAAVLEGGAAGVGGAGFGGASGNSRPAAVRERTLQLISREGANEGKRGPEAPIDLSPKPDAIAHIRDPFRPLAPLRLCVN